MTDVLEMLCYALGDGDFERCDTQGLHQRDGIVVGAVGGAEARHGDAMDAAAVERKIVERAHAYEQGEGRVESAADAYHHVLASRMVETLGES